jgi:hypothetical protein
MQALQASSKPKEALTHSQFVPSSQWGLKVYHLTSYLLEASGNILRIQIQRLLCRGRGSTVYDIGHLMVSEGQKDSGRLRETQEDSEKESEREGERERERERDKSEGKWK